jgi:Lipoyl protein ligase A/B catalytic domain
MLCDWIKSLVCGNDQIPCVSTDTTLLSPLTPLATLLSPLTPLATLLSPLTPLTPHTHTHIYIYIHTRPWRPLDTSPSCVVPAYLIVPAGIQISGAAYKLSGPTSMHHGTLLLDVDMSSLGAYLNPNKLKLKSKGVDSVIARVTNLSVHLPTITHQQVSSKVMEHFLRARLTSQSGAGQLASVADFPVEEVGSSLLDTEPALREAYEKLEVCLRVISYE